MRVRNDIPAQPVRDFSAEAETTDATVDTHAPRHLTAAENVILTIKVLAIAGVLIAALWGLNLWTSAK